MAATRLTDAQKRELAERFRGGATAQAMARELGCSPTTVSRAIRALLPPEEYEALKQGRSGLGRAGSGRSASSAPGAGGVAVPSPPEPLPDPDERRSLAIEDADDFGDDDEDDDLEDVLDDDLVEGELADGDPTGGGGPEAGERDGSPPFVLVPPGQTVQEQTVVEVRALSGDCLPASLYLLVDKTVELQPRPLRECADPGRLPEEEADLQALTAYGNPRTAKRLCNRNQRVIKVPDPQVLLRTSSYLLARGIRRVVLDGTPYALDR